MEAGGHCAHHHNILMAQVAGQLSHRGLRGLRVRGSGRGGAEQFFERKRRRQLRRDSVPIPQRNARLFCDGRWDEHRLGRS